MSLKAKQNGAKHQANWGMYSSGDGRASVGLMAHNQRWYVLYNAFARTRPLDMKAIVHLREGSECGDTLQVGLKGIARREDRVRTLTENHAVDPRDNEKIRRSGMHDHLPSDEVQHQLCPCVGAKNISATRSVAQVVVSESHSSSCQKGIPSLTQALIVTRDPSVHRYGRFAQGRNKAGAYEDQSPGREVPA